MGGILSQPITEKSYNHGEGLGLRYGLCSMQGWRFEMEDAHDVKIGLKYGLKDWSYFAVFDGHAGKRAAAYAAWNLLEFILRDSQLKLQTKDLPGHVPIEPVLDKDNKKSVLIEAGSTNASADKPSSDPSAHQPSTIDHKSPETETVESSSVQDNSRQSPPKSENSNKSSETQQTSSQSENEKEAIEKSASKPELISLPVAEQLSTVKEAIRSGFLKIDESMRDADDLSGCTAICVFISPTHLFIANCGDSRAVLYDGTLFEGIEPKFATLDHKPMNPKERQRIINAGGCVGLRINGTLAVSRALGDFEFKKDQNRGPCEQLVSPEPEVTVIERGPKDEFLILACDGIWDVMSNVELCLFVRHKLLLEPNIQNVCSSVLDLCLHKGSRDNMSIIIVVFENGPQFSEKEVAEEKERDRILAKLARSVRGEYTEWLEFVDKMKEALDFDADCIDSTPLLPPGGGLEAKYDLLHKLFEEEQVRLSAASSSNRSSNESSSRRIN